MDKLINDITQAKKEFTQADAIFTKQQQSLLPTSEEWSKAYDIWNEAWNKHQNACKAYFDNLLTITPKIF